MVSVVRIPFLSKLWNAKCMPTHDANVEAPLYCHEYRQAPTPDGWVGGVVHHIADMRPPRTHRMALCCRQPSMRLLRKESRLTRNVCLPTVSTQHKLLLLRNKPIQQRGAFVRGKFTVSRACYHHTRIVCTSLHIVDSVSRAQSVIPYAGSLKQLHH